MFRFKIFSYFSLGYANFKKMSKKKNSRGMSTKQMTSFHYLIPAIAEAIETFDKTTSDEIHKTMEMDMDIKCSRSDLFDGLESGIKLGIFRLQKQYSVNADFTKDDPERQALGSNSAFQETETDIKDQIDVDVERFVQKNRDERMKKRPTSKRTDRARKSRSRRPERMAMPGGEMSDSEYVKEDIDPARDRDSSVLNLGRGSNVNTKNNNNNNGNVKNSHTGDISKKRSTSGSTTSLRSTPSGEPMANKIKEKPRKRRRSEMSIEETDSISGSVVHVRSKNKLLIQKKSVDSEPCNMDIFT